MNPWNRRLATLSTILLSVSVVSPALGMDPDPPANTHEIPTQLLNLPTPEDLDGSCSFCRVFPVTTTATAPLVAEFSLYFEDDTSSILFDVEITVLLMNDDYRNVLIEDVGLVNQQTTIFTLDAGQDWDWEDAHHAWVEVTPAP